ncbi:MAG: hypothetical protein JXX14_03420 [Deltaproteobacteria bacterium]|nr:hypothetical protein [Deltaproteobacteria bacterium]
MVKISISLWGFLVLGFFTQSVFAGSDAAAADAVFRSARGLLQELKGPDDPELAAAQRELQKLVDDGNRHLLNQKVRKAKIVAEQVTAQMELVRLLVKVAELKAQLNELRESAQQLKSQKEQLESQYQRLVLSQKGRVYSGAFPAPETEAGDVP